MRATILFNENRFIISGLAWVIEAKAFGNGDLGHCGWCPTGLVRVFSRQGSWLLWVLLFSSVMLKSSEKWRDKQLFTLTKISSSCRMMAPWGLPLCVVVQCLECQSAIRVIPALTPPPPASVAGEPLEFSQHFEPWLLLWNRNISTSSRYCEGLMKIRTHSVWGWGYIRDAGSSCFLSSVN